MAKNQDIKKILIIGNHSCSNRGDAAILRGLVELLTQEFPLANITATTRYYDAGKYIINGLDFIDDALFRASHTGNRILQTLKNRAFKKYGAKRLVSGEFNLATPEHQVFSESLDQYNLILQVGGSFFVDLYGTKQYEAPYIVKSKNIPYVMVGHSVGPFETQESKEFARVCFNNVPLLLRESVSLKHYEALNVNNPRIFHSADTAWLVEPVFSPLPENLERFLTSPTVAFTLRDLKPFDTRLGISQDEFEQKIVELSNDLIASGYQILFASTCTGLDAYHKDDRMVAQRVKTKLKCQNKAFVIMDELNDIELGNALGKCILTIGTRLHSAIISNNFGTPAFAIAYEHKSQGILAQMGLERFSIEIHDISNPNTIKIIHKTLNDISTVSLEVIQKVRKEKENARISILEALKMAIKDEK